MTHRSTLPLAPERARLWLLGLAIAAAVLAPRPAAANERHEIAHPFWLPDLLGSYGARGSPLSSRIDGARKGDFAFQLGTPAR